MTTTANANTDTRQTDTGHRVRTVRYELLLRAETPVAHFLGNEGNKSIFRRRDIAQPDGGFEPVPYVSGQAMRNRLRNAAAEISIEAAGLTREQLSEGAVDFLFAGGKLTSKEKAKSASAKNKDKAKAEEKAILNGGSSDTIRLDDFRQISVSMPAQAIFGGCTRTMMMPGELRVSDMLLVCEETQHMLRPWQRQALQSIGYQFPDAASCVQEMTNTRRDPLSDPEKRKLLDQESHAAVLARMQARETASLEQNARDAEDAKSNQMIYSYEVVKQGSLFTWNVWLDYSDPTHLDALQATLTAFLLSARVGGKGGAGDHGRIEALSLSDGEAVRRVDISSLAVRTSACDLFGEGVGARLLAHYRENAPRVAQLLREVG